MDQPMAPTKVRTANEYAELKQRVKDLGLLDKQPRYYAIKIIYTLGLFAASVLFFLLVDNPPLQLLNAVFLAVMFQQVAEIGHDLGHQQITRDRRIYSRFGMFLVFLVGFSREWWMQKHNRHHANPNQNDMDPDIDIPLIAFSEDQALQKRGLAAFVTKYQAFLILPMMVLLQMAGIYGDSTLYVLRKGDKYKLAESILIPLHFVAYFGLIFLRLPLGWALLFLLINQGFMGIFLGMIFAPNHKGMLMLDKDTDLGFLRRQVLTARNLIPNPVIDFWYGGLNYQIEHHLFPDMPRNNLGKARPVVKEFCRERGIPYHETGFFQSWREILSYLHEVGAPLRGGRGDKKPGFLEKPGF